MSVTKNDVIKSLEAMNLKVVFSEAVMTQDEVERFLALETANWKS